MVDASVAAKWVVEEDYSAQATTLLQYDALYAPDHWIAETANVLWSKVFKSELDAEDARERLKVLLRAPVIGMPVADLMQRAFALSVACTITVYASLYVALAETRHVPIVTADRRLIRRLSGARGLAERVVWVGDLVA